MNCPICRRALAVDPTVLDAGGALPKFFPFCSERCKLVDLGRWATGRYAIPGEPVDPDDLPADDGGGRRDAD
jgi:endogenous inhibitor of DNA gyrase (YacG/DUF329 family)